MSVCPCERDIYCACLSRTCRCMPGSCECSNAQEWARKQGCGLALPVRDSWGGYWQAKSEWGVYTFIKLPDQGILL